MGVKLLLPADVTPGAIQVVDARTWAEYHLGHVPGAVRIGWENWCETAPVPFGSPLREPGYWGALRNAPESWYRQRLETLGLLHDRPIAVYAGGASSRGREGRIAWMLLFLGASDVALIDGGWSGWLAHGGAVEVGCPRSGSGHFPVEFQPARRRILNEITEAQRREHGPLLIDTRSRDEYAEVAGPDQSRRGHIPGALLLPFLSLLEPDGRYVRGRAARDLTSRIPAGNSDMVAYCEVGVRAALFALLYEIWTGRMVAVYDGSFTEWSLTAEASEPAVRSRERAAERSPLVRTP